MRLLTSQTFRTAQSGPRAWRPKLRALIQEAAGEAREAVQAADAVDRRSEQAFQRGVDRARAMAADKDWAAAVAANTAEVLAAGRRAGKLTGAACDGGPMADGQRLYSEGIPPVR
jgi:hypothetical protein